MSRRYPGLPKASRRTRERRRQVLVVIGVVTLFVLALLLYVLPGGGGGDEAGPGPGGGTRPAASSTALTSVPAPTGSASAAATRLAGLPALTDLPNSTSLTTLGPGAHRIVMTASSDEPMLAVSYRIKGSGTGKVFYNVKSPVVISRTLTGTRPYAAIALQVGPNGRTGTCRITIDGEVVDTRSIPKPYAVMGCVG